MHGLVWHFGRGKGIARNKRLGSSGKEKDVIVKIRVLCTARARGREQSLKNQLGCTPALGIREEEGNCPIFCFSPPFTCCLLFISFFTSKRRGKAFCDMCVVN